MAQTITANNSMLIYAIRLMAESYAQILCGTYNGANTKEEVLNTLEALKAEAAARGIMDNVNPILNEVFA